MEEKNIKYFSEILLSYIQLGLWVERLKTDVKNPEFLARIEDLKKDNKIFEWTQALSENEARGIRDAISLELDTRFKQEKLVR